MPDILSSVFNPQELSPAASYGVQLANLSQVPSSGVDVKEPSSMSTSTSAGDHVALHWNNPMFWFLILLLLFVGYVGFLFDFSVKKIGSINLKGGKG
jgi:hypothetical protein